MVFQQIEHAVFRDVTRATQGVALVVERGCAALVFVDPGVVDRRQNLP